MKTNKSEIARLLLDWEEAKRDLEILEARIERAVKEWGETQVAGNVRATYSAGRKTYFYEEAAGAAGVSAETLAEYTTVETVEKTEWRLLCLSGLGLKQTEILFTQTEPRVTLKLLEYD
jgi:hypothetical protein